MAASSRKICYHANVSQHFGKLFTHYVELYLPSDLTLYESSKHCFNLICNSSIDCCMRPHMLSRRRSVGDWVGRRHGLVGSGGNWETLGRLPATPFVAATWCAQPLLVSRMRDVTIWLEIGYWLVQVFISHMRSERRTRDWSSQQYRPWPLYSCVFCTHRFPPLPDTCAPSATYIRPLILVTAVLSHVSSYSVIKNIYLKDFYQ